MKIFLRAALLALLACVCCTASAQMYKCSKGNGTYNYQPTPCDPGVNEQQLDRKGHVAKPQDPASAQSQVYPEVGVTSPDKPLVRPAAPAPAMPPESSAPQTADAATQAALKGGAAVGVASVSFIATIVVMVLMFMLFLLPLKMGAVLLKTGKTGWWACLIAGFACMAISVVCFAVLPNNGLRFISILVSALAFVVFLQTDYWRGLVLGAIAFIFYVYIPEFVVKKYEHQRALKEQQESAVLAPAPVPAILPAKLA